MIAVLVSLFITAQAGTRACTSADAPTAYWNHQCDGVCAKISNEWECDLENLCLSGGGWAYVVSTNDADFSAWGECDGDNFCCAHDESVAGEIDIVSLWGTDFDDQWLGFTDIDVQYEYLGGDFTGNIHGRDGSDWIAGSTTRVISAYYENLYGNAGDDNIWGMGTWNTGNNSIESRDYLDGGMGDDNLYGAGILVGGPGSDDLQGTDTSNDVLCDSNGSAQGCTANHGDLFRSYGMNDALWYEIYGSCTGELDPASDAGVGDTDTCGNSDDFTFGDLPQYCDSYTDTKPNYCP